jgi:hypothetical protein
MKMTNNGNNAITLLLERTSTSGATVSFYRNNTLLPSQRLTTDDAITVPAHRAVTAWIVGETESPKDMRDVQIKIHQGRANGPVVDQEAVTVLWVTLQTPRAAGLLSDGYPYQGVLDTLLGRKSKKLGVVNSQGGTLPSGRLAYEGHEKPFQIREVAPLGREMRSGMA